MTSVESWAGAKVFGEQQCIDFQVLVCLLRERIVTRDEAPRAPLPTSLPFDWQLMRGSHKAALQSWWIVLSYRCHVEQLGTRLVHLWLILLWSWDFYEESECAYPRCSHAVCSTNLRHASLLLSSLSITEKKLTSRPKQLNQSMCICLWMPSEFREGFWFSASLHCTFHPVSPVQLCVHTCLSIHCECEAEAAFTASLRLKMPSTFLIHVFSSSSAVSY